MLSPEQMDRGAAEVAAAARAEGVRVLLVGGVAMAHYGSDRFTGNLDVVADRALGALPRERELPFGGYQSRTPSGVPASVILRADDYTDVFKDALLHGRTVEGLALPLVSAEHLVAMKLLARRPKDLLDLATLVTLNAFDEAKALRIVKSLLGAYAAEDLRSHIREARWRAERG
jgi:hypothetical protein